MITKLELKNFKAHKNAFFDLKGLNVFTGKNGMGKSSIIQSILLLRQSYLSQRKFEGLILNGDLVMIGNSQDAFCESGDGDEIEFVITDENSCKHQWLFSRNVDKNFLPLKNSVNEDDFSKLEMFGKNFQYIAAEHLAAKESHERNTYFVEQLNQISEKHGDGKYTVHYLSNNAEKDITFPQMGHEKAKSLKLKSQVEAWLHEISPSIKLTINENSAQNSVSLRYQFETNLGQTKEYKPENVGFGVSYIIPVLVAILTAKKSGIILIENPEAHLHPAGQSVIGKLFCLAAQCGIQLIVETHSDHIVNSILVNIVENKRNSSVGINPENVAIYFIEREKESHISLVHPIKIRDDARIIGPPKDFFDQFSKDMKLIMGF
ncbi:AAA family ATPase [Sphingobacterium kyonggiense]